MVEVGGFDVNVLGGHTEDLGDGVYSAADAVAKTNNLDRGIFNDRPADARYRDGLV